MIHRAQGRLAAHHILPLSHNSAAVRGTADLSTLFGPDEEWAAPIRWFELCHC